MQQRPNSNLWFHRSQPRPQARFRLFCFPFAGGGIAAFHSWPNHLPIDIEVCALQLPGRDNRMREAPVDDLNSLVHALSDGLADHLNLPYAFYGHSMGALIAYELTRDLRRRRMNTPVHLFVSSRRAPHLPSRERDCHQLPDDEFVRTLIQRYNGIPQAVLAEPELMKLFLPILRADFTLMETYAYVLEEPLQQPLTIFGGVEDRIVGGADLEAWKQTTIGPSELHIMPGGHFFIQTAQTLLLPLVARRLLDTSLC